MLRDRLTNTLEALLENPYPSISRDQPLPTKMQLSEQLLCLNIFCGSKINRNTHCL